MGLDFEIFEDIVSEHEGCVRVKRQGQKIIWNWIDNCPRRALLFLKHQFEMIESNDSNNYKTITSNKQMLHLVHLHNKIAN